MKKIFSLIIALALIVSSLAILTACGSNEEGNTAYVAVDINPEVELILDNENKVASFRAANEDAQVMLYGEVTLVGMDAEAAVEKITELAIEYGYLAEDNTVVGLTVLADKNSDRLQAKLGESVEAAATRKSFDLTIDTGASYSVNRKLEALKAKYPDNEKIQNITLPEFKLALSASENGDITVEAAIEMDTEALLDYVNEGHSKMEEYATDAFNMARDVAEATYNQVVGVAEDAVYYEVLLEKVLENPEAFVNAGAYQSYKMISRSLNAIATAWDYLEDLSKQPLTEEQIAAAVEALGLEDSTVIEDSEGNVTVESIEAYADKMFKNSEAGEALEAKMQTLTDSLETFEADIQEKVNEKLVEFKPQIESLIQAGEKILEAMELIVIAAPTTVKEALTLAISDFEDITEKYEELIEDGEISANDLRTVAGMFDEKAGGAKEKMTASLTEEDLAEIEEKQADAVAKLSEAKSELDKAINDAEAEAKAHLSSLKNAITEKLA